jgi:hypothetical protein
LEKGEFVCKSVFPVDFVWNRDDADFAILRRLEPKNFSQPRTVGWRVPFHDDVFRRNLEFLRLLDKISAAIG